LYFREDITMPTRIAALECCKTLDEIDNFLSLQGFESIQDKCDFLIDYMGIIDFYLDGGEAEPEFLYSILRESFCDGDWRLICGKQNYRVEE
jgi:hypothetical protein